MTKQSIQQYSQTPSSNTDIAGININTGWSPANVGPAFRTLMAQLATLVQPVTVAVGAGGVTLTSAQASADVIVATGSPGATVNIVFPGTPTSGLFQNAVSDGSSLVLTTGSGGTVQVPSGSAMFYVCDGTNIYANALSNPLNVNGNATVSGNATIEGGATVDESLTVGQNVTIDQTLYGNSNAQFEGYVNILGSQPLTGDSWIDQNTAPYSGAWSVGAALNAPNGWLISLGSAISSDGRLKTDISDITPQEGESWVLRGRPRTYRMGEKWCAGFVAQEDVRAGRGAAVTHVLDKDDRFAESDGIAPPGHRLIRDYEHDIPYLTAALQSALARIEQLEKKMTEMLSPNRGA